MWWWFCVGGVSGVDECGGDVRHSNGGECSDGGGECGAGFVSVV